MKAAKLLPSATALLVLAAISGCVTGFPNGAPYAPPEPLPEAPSTAPAPGMVRVAGTWHWDGTDYVWVPGHWESPPPSP
jgi:hypothetical protein